MMKGIIFAIYFLLLGLSVYSQETQKVNLVQNPGFENASANDPAKPDWWGTEDWGGSPKQYTWDDKVAHTGKRSVCIECPQGSAGAWLKYFWKNKDKPWKDKDPLLDASFKPDKFYKMSVWVKADAGAVANIILDGCEVMMGARPLQATSGPHDWKQLVIKGAQLNTATNYVGICLVCRGGKVWFDDVEVVEMVEMP